MISAVSLTHNLVTMGLYIYIATLHNAIRVLHTTYLVPSSVYIIIMVSCQSSLAISSVLHDLNSQRVL